MWTRSSGWVGAENDPVDIRRTVQYHAVCCTPAQEAMQARAAVGGTVQNCDRQSERVARCLQIPTMHGSTTKSMMSNVKSAERDLCSE